MVAAGESNLVSALVRSRRALSGANVPHSFVFTDRQTLVFLGADGSVTRHRPTTSLYAVHLPEPIPHEESGGDRVNSTDAKTLVPWTSLIPASVLSAANETGRENAFASKEETLLRERRRLQAIGIKFYKAHTKARKLFFYLHGELYLAPFPRNRTASPSDQHDITNIGKEKGHTSVVEPLALTRVGLEAEKSDLAASRMDPKFAPDASMISFVRDGDLWVMDLASGFERRLTYSENPCVPSTNAGQAGYTSTHEEQTEEREQIPDLKSDKSTESVSAKQMNRAQYQAAAKHASTLKHDACSHKSNRVKTCGVADYISQEEFGRCTAAWWRPEKNPETGNFELLYLVVDHSKTPVVQLPDYCSMQGTVEQFHYPRPGDANCVTEPAVVAVPPPPPMNEKLKLAEWAAADPRDVADKYFWAPTVPVMYQYPWAEYVVRAGWIPSMSTQDDWRDANNNKDGTFAACKESDKSSCAWFWLQLLDRRQKISNFVAISTSGPGRGVAIATDCNSKFWINVNDAYCFLKKQAGFIFCSERSGYAHLYYKDISALEVTMAPPLQQEEGNVLQHILVRTNTQRRTDTSDTDIDNEFQCNHNECQEHGGSFFPGTLRQISNGESWMVEEIVHVDESRQLLYFTSTSSGPLERQLCVASYAAHAHPSNVYQLTESGYTHTNFAFDGGHTRFVACYSSLSNPVQSVVYDLYGLIDVRSAQCNEGTLILQDPAAVHIKEVVRIANPVPHPGNNMPWSLQSPEIFEFRTVDDTKLYGALYRPTALHRTDPDAGPIPHPTILAVYGGPRVQTVRNEWQMTLNLKSQMLAAHGYAVVMIDGRGSHRRGINFEGVFARGFGNCELEDQVRGLKHLLARGIVDPARICCTGWSYGAYAACMLLAKYPSFFRMAVCGAAVVNWEDYDAAYTERYLGLLGENSAFYTASSILSYAKSLPDRDDCLLLVASLKDENVHCSHTISLVDTLVKLNKPHRLLLFPQERHGLRAGSSQLHFETTFFQFISSLRSDACTE